MVSWSLVMPSYTDVHLAEQIILSPNCHDRAALHRWYHRVDELRTLRWPIFDGGMTLILLVTMAIIADRYFDVKTAADIRNLHTPSRVRDFIYLGVPAAIVIALGSLIDLFWAWPRAEVPWCADSPAWPLTGIFLGFLAVVILIFISCVAIFSLRIKLPVSLWISNNKRPLRTAIVSIPFILFAIIGAIVVLLSFGNSTVFMIPGVVMGIYLTLSLRAALVSKGMSEPGAKAGVTTPSQT